MTRVSESMARAPRAAAPVAGPGRPQAASGLTRTLGVRLAAGGRPGDRHGGRDQTDAAQAGPGPDHSDDQSLWPSRAGCPP